MRNRWKVVTGLALAGGIAVGCGAYTVPEGTGGALPTPTPSGTVTATPTPDATPPTQASFTTNVEPILEGVGATTYSTGGCDVGACHGAATGSGGLYLKVKTITPDPVYNYMRMTCSLTMDNYSPPAGAFLNHFCTDATTPKPGGHNGNQFTAAQCTAMYNWAATGSTGLLPSCPGL